LHDDAVHGQVALDQLDHVGAEVADDEGGDEGAQDVGDPGEDHIHQVQALQVALFHIAPADVLPHQVDGGGAVEQHGAQGAHGGGQGHGHILGGGGGGVKPCSADIQ